MGHACRRSGDPFVDCPGTRLGQRAFRPYVRVFVHPVSQMRAIDPAPTKISPFTLETVYSMVTPPTIVSLYGAVRLNRKDFGKLKIKRSNFPSE